MSYPTTPKASVSTFRKIIHEKTHLLQHEIIGLCNEWQHTLPKILTLCYINSEFKPCGLAPPPPPLPYPCRGTPTGGEGATRVWNARMCVLGVWNCTHYEGCLMSNNIPILKGYSAHLILISWCNIKLKYIIHNTSLSSHLIYSMFIVAHSHRWVLSLYTILNIKSPILSDAANFRPILSEIFSLTSLPGSQNRTHVLHFWTHTSGHSWNQVAPPPPGPTAPG